MSAIRAASLVSPAGQPESSLRAATSPNLPIGYLRAFVTVLVLAHHAVLAYYPFAPPVPSALVAESRWWMAFPAVDSQRWSGFGLFVGFNDIFSCR